MRWSSRNCSVVPRSQPNTGADAAEFEAAQANAVSDAKDLFLPSMSHEIRTPLSSLLSRLGMAQSQLEDKPPQELSDGSAKALLNKLSLCHQVIGRVPPLSFLFCDVWLRFFCRSRSC